MKKKKKKKSRAASSLKTTQRTNTTNAIRTAINLTKEAGCQHGGEDRDQQIIYRQGKNYFQVRQIALGAFPWWHIYTHYYLLFFSTLYDNVLTIKKKNKKKKQTKKNNYMKWHRKSPSWRTLFPRHRQKKIWGTMASHNDTVAITDMQRKTATEEFLGTVNRYSYWGGGEGGRGLNYLCWMDFSTINLWSDLILVYTVWRCSFNWTLGINGLN